MTSRPPLPTREPTPQYRTSIWRHARGAVPLTTPVVMGILNPTPDSFSDGGDLTDSALALARAERMIAEGAGILDVGGESTRPGATDVSVSEEIRRVVPVIEALVRRFDVPVSIDTRKAAVASAALDAGAVIVNDVSGLAFDDEMGALVASRGAGVVLMHMRGTPADMRERASYDDVVPDVAAELTTATERARAAGIAPDAVVVDPGIGFAKTTHQSLALIGGIAALVDLGFPVLVGPSRKRFLGEILDVPPRERGVGTAAACVMAFLGGACIFRVHDVAPTVQALAVARAVTRARGGSTQGSERDKGSTMARAE